MFLKSHDDDDDEEGEEEELLLLNPIFIVGFEEYRERVLVNAHTLMIPKEQPVNTTWLLLL